jgi:hypothetical protein
MKFDQTVNLVEVSLKSTGRPKGGLELLAAIEREANTLKS